MAKLIDLNGLAHVYSIIKGMLADKLGKNDTAVNASKVNNLTVETAVPKNAKFTDTVYTHPSTHPASMITGLSTVATSGSYSDLSNKPTIPVVPTKVSAFINDAGYLTQHQSLDDYASKADVSALMSTKLGVTDTAYAATRDGAGNNIVDTYAKKTDISGFVKTVNGTAPDTNGNVAINVSGGGGGGVSTSEVNTWTAEQIFNDVTIGVDAGKLNVISNSTATPTTSYTFVTFDGPLLTLDFSALSAQASSDTLKTLKFKIVILAWENIPTLKIINAGTSVCVPENTKLGGLINLLDGMVIFDGNEIATIFHVTNMSHDGGNIS